MALGKSATVEGETAAAADGLDGEPEPGPGVVPTSFASVFARSVDTSFSDFSVIVSLDFFLTTLMVDPLLVDMVEVFEGRLSSREVGLSPVIESIVSRLLPFDGTGGGGVVDRSST